MRSSFFHGKTVWLIGASEGIGRCVAQQLADTGATVIISARQTDRLQTLLSEMNGIGHRIITCDVGNETSVTAAWQQISPSGVDMVIYNAGLYEPMAADHINIEIATRVMDINFTGALRVLAQVVPYFTTLRRGHIALVASVAGYRGLPAAIPYGASKAALMHLAENLMCDLRRYGIKIQVINPGFVATRLTAKNDFSMPSIISPEVAARHIINGLTSNRFEIVFPFWFSRVMKLLSILPQWIYFRLVSRSA